MRVTEMRKDKKQIRDTERVKASNGYEIRSALEQKETRRRKMTWKTVLTKCSTKRRLVR